MPRFQIGDRVVDNEGDEGTVTGFCDCGEEDCEYVDVDFDDYGETEVCKYTLELVHPRPTSIFNPGDQVRNHDGTVATFSHLCGCGHDCGVAYVMHSGCMFEWYTWAMSLVKPTPRKGFAKWIKELEQ